MSKKLLVLVVYNKNKNPQIAAKAKQKFNILKKYVENKRLSDPDFAR